MAEHTGALISTAEAAQRLGVKPATLYAYVSRGLLASIRGADGRTSLFDPDEVDRLITRPRRGRTPRAAPFTIHTRLTDLRDGRLFYRGLDVGVLASSEPFESVARWLWTGVLDPAPMTAPAPTVELAARLAGSLPRSARTVDRIRTMIAGIAAADPLRADLRPEAVAATAGVLLATVVDGLPGRGAVMDGVEPIAVRLWEKLAPAGPPPGSIAVLDGALVLLADHDLAASTLAARIAASTRAHPYAVVAAGLATLDGPLHGGASASIHRALAEAEREGSGTVLSRFLSEGRSLPGFGHLRYPGGDPRGRVLLDQLAATPPDAERWALVAEFLAASARGTPVPPNVDFALAALSFTAGMEADAGEAVLAIARTVGWIAHALEEYAEEPRRFRPQAVYFGPDPAPPSRH
jgi:citrate synthase